MATFDIRAAFADKEWLEEISCKLARKMAYGIKKARQVSFMPYTTQNGQWKETRIGGWTNGFWPASMWQMYLMTGDASFRAEALRAEAMLDDALKDFKNLSHDVGFMWLIHSGVRYHLEHNQDSFDRTLYAADMLACRYNPNGFLRAWNQVERAGWAIVDCMMNLPILYWASRQTADPRYKLMAMNHADTTIKYFIRPDGSCNHIVIFDPENGEYMDNPGGQGCQSGSSWSRGQSWALYGFVLSYILSGKAEYLDAAKRVANYFIDQCCDDWLPRCDFRQPEGENVLDNAAGNIAACGLIELARQLPQVEGKRYFDAALCILKAQEADAANWAEDDPAIFTKCTTAYHDLKGRHITMTYADYFFIEAVNKLRGEELLFWDP